MLFGQSKNSFYRVFGVHFKGIQKVLSFEHTNKRMKNECFFNSYRILDYSESTLLYSLFMYVGFVIIYNNKY